MKIRRHHRDVAKEMGEWLSKNPNALHQEIFETFDRIADRNYKAAKIRAKLKKETTSK
jgi:hypothetical protein